MPLRRIMGDQTLGAVQHVPPIRGQTSQTIETVDDNDDASITRLFGVVLQQDHFRSNFVQDSKTIAIEMRPHRVQRPRFPLKLCRRPRDGHIGYVYFGLREPFPKFAAVVGDSLANRSSDHFFRLRP